MTTPDPIQQVITLGESVCELCSTTQDFWDKNDYAILRDFADALAALRKAREGATYFTGTNEDPPALLIPLEPNESQ